MKQSHYTTPRTLAECEFRVGHRIAHQRGSNFSGVIAAVALGLMVGVLLALGV